MLQLPVKSREATFVVVLMTTDAQLRKRDIENFGGNPYSPSPPKSNNLKRKASKRTLKNSDKDLKCSSPQLITSGEGVD